LLKGLRFKAFKLYKNKKKYTKQLLNLPPLFIIGCGRSGTTALYDALNAHPNISMYGYEAPLFHHVGDILYQHTGGRFKDYYSDANKIGIDNFSVEMKSLLLKSLFGRDYGFQHHVTLELLHKKPFSSIQYWGTKVFPSEDQFNGLKNIFPGAKTIYIYRNGIDVVNSMTKFKGFKERGFKELCRIWANAQANYLYLESHTNAIVIRFENLVNQPRIEVSRILEFLDLSYSENIVNYLESKVNHPLDQRQNQEGNIKEIIKKRESAYLEWGEYDKKLFYEICGQGMDHFGYEIK
jgi:hypothetical protein